MFVKEINEKSEILEHNYNMLMTNSYYKQVKKLNG